MSYLSIQNATFWLFLKNFWTFSSKKSLVIAPIVVQLGLNSMNPTAVGSSECERGFSIMNHIRTKRRARLSADTIDALMRIREGIIQKIILFLNYAYNLWCWGYLYLFHDYPSLISNLEITLQFTTNSHMHC